MPKAPARKRPADLAHKSGSDTGTENLPLIPRGVRPGRLLVEAIIPDDDSPHLAKDLDIRLITILPGGGRTEPEYARLLAEAGFRPEPAVALARIESVMVAIPAS
jgi:hypothetical protein